KAKKILDVVKEKLLTPFGLRSLSVDDVNYKGWYDGDIVQRDGAYHQGTVWSWLIGPYIDALFNCYGKAAKPEAQQAIQQLLLHLNDAGIGSISEIFDGDAPHKPRGCIAQAWSVAELLRVIRQYGLYDFNSNDEDITTDK
ncbi:MAG: amylo-alpha-1,6-glucosidase, partial [Chitinophagales bacterium]